MLASKPAPAITAKCSPFTQSGIQRAASPVQPDPDRFGDVGRDAEILREQVEYAQAGGIATAVLAPATASIAALHRAVAAPDEDKLGARRDRAANTLRRLAALRHLVPDRVGMSLLVQHPPELIQAAAEALARVRHYRDNRHAAASILIHPAGQLSRLARTLPAFGRRMRGSLQPVRRQFPRPSSPGLAPLVVVTGAALVFAVLLALVRIGWAPLESADHDTAARLNALVASHPPSRHRHQGRDQPG